MSALRRRAVAALVAVALALAAAGPARAQADADRLRNAKALFFDGKYIEARQAWQSVLARGAEADTAAFWIARCSEKLGEYERALKEYQAFLDRRPVDRALGEDARTSRVAIAARLVKSGQPQYLPILKDALADPSKTVRYYAALQLAGLGPQAGAAAVPVLKRILESEKDEDLVERAKLALLRLDPAALAPARAPAAAPSASRREASWLRVRITKRGQSQPAVSINLPVALAELVFKSLPEGARRELREKGYDADNFWGRLKKLGPTEIVTIEGDDGERIQIWIE